MPAIRIENSTGGRFSNVRIEGFDVGIEAINSDFIADGISFDNVRQPWHIRGDSAEVSGTRISRDPKQFSAGKDRVGWTPVAGHALPAKCPKCKSIFPSVNYKVQQSRFWSRDNEEVCPVCKYEHAKVADGVFDITDAALRFLAGPEASLAMLKAIQEIARSAASEEISAEEAVAKFEQTSPAFASFAKSALGFGQAALIYLAAAATIATMILVIHYEEKDLQMAADSAAETSHFQERTIEVLSSIVTVLKEIQDSPGPYQGREPTSSSPSEGNAPTKPGLTKLKPDGLGDGQDNGGV